MNFPSSYHWLFKAIALALVVPVPVGVLAYSATRVQDAPESAFVVVIFAVPPLWLMALVLLGRAAMEGGLTEEAKGELEQLLLKKQLGVLSAQPRRDWHRAEYAVPAPAPAPQPAPVESGPVLDQLLAWKRRNCPGPDEAHDPP
jgi:hypothetical protein